MTSYADRLQRAMRRAATEAPALATAVGLTRQGIYKVLKGGTEALNAPNNAKVAQWLGVNADWLALGAGEMEREPALSREALKLASEFDQMTESQRQSIRMVFLALSPRAVSDAHVQAAMPITSTTPLASKRKIA